MGTQRTRQRRSAAWHGAERRTARGAVFGGSARRATLPRTAAVPPPPLLPPFQSNLTPLLRQWPTLPDDQTSLPTTQSAVRRSVA